MSTATAAVITLVTLVAGALATVAATVLVGPEVGACAIVVVALLGSTAALGAAVQEAQPTA
jgi:tagatose-1,6-bisphosphate aldolase